MVSLGDVRRLLTGGKRRALRELCQVLIYVSRAPRPRFGFVGQKNLCLICDEIGQLGDPSAGPALAEVLRMGELGEDALRHAAAAVANIGAPAEARPFLARILAARVKPLRLSPRCQWPANAEKYSKMERACDILHALISALLALGWEPSGAYEQCLRDVEEKRWDRLSLHHDGTLNVVKSFLYDRDLSTQLALVDAIARLRTEECYAVLIERLKAGGARDDVRSALLEAFHRDDLALYDEKMMKGQAGALQGGHPAARQIQTFLGQRGSKAPGLLIVDMLDKTGIYHGSVSDYAKAEVVSVTHPSLVGPLVALAHRKHSAADAAIHGIENILRHSAQRVTDDDLNLILQLGSVQHVFATHYVPDLLADGTDVEYDLRDVDVSSVKELALRERQRREGESKP